MMTTLGAVLGAPAVGALVQALSVPNAAKAAMDKPDIRRFDGVFMTSLLKIKRMGLVSQPELVLNCARNRGNTVVLRRDSFISFGFR